MRRLTGSLLLQTSKPSFGHCNHTPAPKKAGTFLNNRNVMRVLFADATVGFSPYRKDKAACGGILTSLTVIPKYLASKGFDVVVKSAFETRCTIDGVEYIPSKDEEKLKKWDVLVVNRNGINNGLVEYSHSMGAKVVWWLHDIVDMRYLSDGAYRKVDKIVALSQYCKDSYCRFYDIPLDKFEVIPNGVDRKVFYPGDYTKRKRYKMILASALIKGVDPVMDVWNNARRQFRDAELVIYSSQGLHDLKNNKVQSKFLTDMEKEGARVIPPIPQSILADKMRESGILLMPNSYPEICSNLLLQAQSCGLPVVASNIGSVGEFIENGKTGVLSECYPHDMWLWIKLYVEAVMKLLKDDVKHKHISEMSPHGAQDWKEIGELWFECISKLKK